MTYDLRFEPWIPWRRRSGQLEWGPPALVADLGPSNPVVAIAAPRPDLGAALEEFLVGLLTTAFEPEDETQWLELWRNPPTPADVQRALMTLPSFDLEADGPRAFQDFEEADFADVSVTPIEQLFVDAAGSQTIRLNKDLFVKRERFERLGRPAAAMALVTMQTYAPSGGQGHRTSLRGGGPLTTLVDPRVEGNHVSRAHDLPLWQKVWANVQTREQWLASTSDSLADIQTAFPWLQPTRTSEPKTGKPTTPADVHPLHAYFGMPRRIRLEFSGPGTCDVTGQHDQRTVVGFRMRNYGTQYIAWRHPLTPYYQAKERGEWLPVHGQPGGISWRDWLGLAFRAADGQRKEPARAVAAFQARANRLRLSAFRVHVFGYDFDNMKARGWTEAAMPSFAIEDPRKEQLVRDLAVRFNEGAELAALALVGQVKRALFGESENAPGDWSSLKGELWAATEQAFYDAMAAVVSATEKIDDVPDARCQQFAKTLEAEATAIFDRWCPSSGTAPNAMRRLVSARYGLVMTLRGYSALGEKLFAALRIPLPGGGRAARKSTKRTRKESAK